MVEPRMTMATTTIKDVESFAHCKDCLEERPDGVSPYEWARLSIGLTTHGTILVWCVRHEAPVTEIVGVHVPADG